MNRWPKCRSSNTWDDMTMWGCNDCGWMGSNMPIGLVRCPNVPNAPKLEEDEED